MGRLNGKWGAPHFATIQLPILHSPHFATARGDGMPHNSPKDIKLGGKTPICANTSQFATQWGKNGGNYTHNDGKMGNKPLPNLHTYSYL